MRKILLIANRNVLTSCGELRLMKNRAEALYHRYGIGTDVIAFGTKDRIHSPKREVFHAGGTFQVIPVKSMVFSPLLLGKAIPLAVKMQQANGYEAILLSGTGMAGIAKKLKKKLGLPIVADIHGASEDMLMLAKTGPLLQRLKRLASYLVDTYTLKYCLQYADGCFVVSQALQQYVCERFPVPPGTRFYRVPCATSAGQLSRQEYRQNREFYRRKFGIDPDTKVFVYSGGVSAWQCIGETVALYRSIRERYRGKTKLLMFSHNVEQLKALAGTDPDILYDSFRPEELEAALCAGDCAFLLRRNHVTNHVAFPNKFLEYVRSGMQIIATPHVHDIADQMENDNLGILVDFAQDDGERVARYAERDIQPDFALRTQILQAHGFEQTLKPFVDDLDANR